MAPDLIYILFLILCLMVSYYAAIINILKKIETLLSIDLKRIERLIINLQSSINSH